jgi:hypothetical protein
MMPKPYLPEAEEVANRLGEQLLAHQRRHGAGPLPAQGNHAFAVARTPMALRTEDAVFLLPLVQELAREFDLRRQLGQQVPLRVFARHERVVGVL